MSQTFKTAINIDGKAPSVFVMSIPGTLVTGVGAIRLPIWRPITILNIQIIVTTAPTGAAIILDVNKNDVTLFTTQGNRPTIAISGNTDTSSIPDITAATSGDYITVDVDQVGSTIAGADLTLIIEYI